jgi:hypothetical protein
VPIFFSAHRTSWAYIRPVFLNSSARLVGAPEFWGGEAICHWVARELVGDRVTVAVTEVLDHHGDTIVRGRYDGDYDKTNLPDELILINYVTVRDGKIVTLIVIRNTPASY